MSVESALKVALGLVTLALTAVGTLLAIVLIPASSPGALKPLAVSLIGLAVLAGCAIIGRALVWSRIQTKIREAHQVGEDRLRTYQRALGQLVARWPTSPVTQIVEHVVSVGPDDAGDRTHEAYTFTPSTSSGVLFWSLNYGSQSAAAAAPGHRLTTDSAGLAVAVARVGAAGQILHTILRTEDVADERRLEALVVLQPTVKMGETACLTADYRVPGTWTKLRQEGEDYFAVSVPAGGSVTALRLTFLLPPKASGVSWTLTEAPSGAPPCPPAKYPARSDDAIELHWASGPNPGPGRYRFDIRMNPLR